MSLRSYRNHSSIDGEVFLMSWRSADSLDGRYFGVLPITAIVRRAEPLGLTRRTDLASSSQSSCHSFVRSGHGPFLRPGQGSHRRRAQRRSRAAVRLARQRFTLDGRERDGSVAISRGDDVHCGDSCIIHVVERCSACRASVVGRTSSKRFVRRSLHGFCHRCVQALRRAGTLDTRSAASRKRRQITSAIAEWRHGVHADHAKDVG